MYKNLPNEEPAIKNVLQVPLATSISAAIRFHGVVWPVEAPKLLYLSGLRVPREKLGPRPAWINDIQVLNALSHPLDAYSTALTPPQM
jgi:hypothetical protein